MKAKIVEIVVLALFISGIFLWDKIQLSWGIFKINQLAHIIIALLVFVVLLIPFIISHIKEHKKIIMKKRKGHLKRKQTGYGIFLGLSILAIFLTGIYLFFIGNRGGDIYGQYSLDIHFYGSFLLMFLLFYHSYFLGRRLHHKYKEGNKC